MSFYTGILLELTRKHCDAKFIFNLEGNLVGLRHWAGLPTGVTSSSSLKAIGGL